MFKLTAGVSEQIAGRIAAAGEALCLNLNHSYDGDGPRDRPFTDATVCSSARAWIAG